MTDTSPLDPILVATVEHAVATGPEQLEALLAEHGLASMPPPGLREPAAQALVHLVLEHLRGLLEETPDLDQAQLAGQNYSAVMLMKAQRLVATWIDRQGEDAGPWPSPAHAVLGHALATLGPV
ncbi:MAG: hypothetical protein AMXMBFR33_56190 [Candidatus Xenobia bacterium]